MGEAKRRRELGLKPEDRPKPTPVPPRRAWRPLRLQLGGKTYELHVDGKVYERGRGRRGAGVQPGHIVMK